LVKNHVNGTTLSGSICSTPWVLDPLEKNAYVKENNKYINEKLGTDYLILK
jgi:hypothetical protein